MLKMKEEEEKAPQKITDIEALRFSVESSVEEFARKWLPVPRFGIGVEVMDQRQLRDAMGLRASIDWGDPWPVAEQMLLERNFRWHWLSGLRVMYVMERDDMIACDDGWNDGEELVTDTDNR